MNAASTDAIVDLARFVLATDFRSLSEDVKWATRVEIIDTVGCTLGGHGVVATEGLSAVAGGPREGNWGSVWGAQMRHSAPDAALLNGTIGHALEFDDTHDSGALHVGVTVIPAAVAAAESIGARGIDVLSGTVAGIEVAARLAKAINVGPGVSGWLLTPLCGYFGAAAGAGRVLGLNEEQLIHAFGLAYAQAAGNGQATLDGGEAKRTQAGFAARGGLLAAMLAKSGVTAARSVLEGPRGFFRVYHQSDYERDRLTEDLGSRFEVDQLSLKPYPCCRWTHAAIETAFALRESGVDVAEIDRIEVLVNQQSYNSTGSDPERRQRPATPIEAQFSIPYTFAVAFLRGRVGLEHFTEDAIRNEDVLALARRVVPLASVAQDGSAARSLSGAVTTISTIGGEFFRESVASPSQLRPGLSSLGEIRDKFQNLGQFGGLDEEFVRRSLHRLEHLDEIDHIAELLPVASEELEAQA